MIATQPKTSDGGVDLASDLALTKAALLYADTVELVSPGAAMIAATGTLEAATTSDALDLLGSFDHDTMQRIGGGALPDNWRQIVETARAVDQAPPALKRQLLRATPELAELFEMVRGFDDSAAQLRSVAAGMVDASGLRELDEAIRLGVVTVNEVGVGRGDADAMLAEYVDHIKCTLQDPAVHALFDASSASLARSLVREGHVEPNRMTLVHAKQAAVGGGLVAKLPSFPNSDMRDVLGLREDLRSPLGRYRRAVVALSEKLGSHAFDEESAVEVEDLWLNEVAPTLDDLRDGMERHTFVRHFAKQVGAEPMTVVAGVGSPGAILMGFQAITGVDSILSTLTAAVPAVASATSLAVKAATARGGELEKLHGNDLFYLHEINRRLAST